MRRCLNCEAHKFGQNLKGIIYFISCILLVDIANIFFIATLESWKDKIMIQDRLRWKLSKIAQQNASLVFAKKSSGSVGTVPIRK